MLFTKDETPKKLLSLRKKNPLIEHTVPHNMSINACSGEILTLQTYYTPAAAVVRRPVSANPGLNFNPGLFFFSSKAFSLKIFSVLFRVANHQIVDKKN